MNTTTFKKGHITWNKGILHSEETKKKIGLAHKGKIVSQETRQKMSQAHKNRKPSKEHIEKIRIALTGKKFSNERKQNISKSKQGTNIWKEGRNFSEEHKKNLSNAVKKQWLEGKRFGKPLKDETKKKISESHKGEKNYNWQCGKSFEPYGLEFNDDLKEVIRNRDRRKCQICNKTELDNGSKLDIHHIDYDKKNNNPNNLISLCMSCHAKTGKNREYWNNYLKEESK